MDNPHDHNIVPGAGQPRQDGIAPPRSLFAEESGRLPAVVPSRPHPPLAKRPFNVLTRIVLPVAILLVGIAGIAWIAQFLPSRGRPQPAPAGKDAQIINPLQFQGKPDRWGAVCAVFSPEDYDPEYEVGQGGHYDFPFTNTSGVEAEVGVAEKNCVCSGVKVCVFEGSQRDDYEKAKTDEAFFGKLKWRDLEPAKDMKQAALIPAGASGLLRIMWGRNQSQPELKNLTANVWSRVAGSYRDPGTTTLKVKVKYVYAAQFESDRVDAGVISPNGEGFATFHCWSATSDIEVKPANFDPRIKVETVKLDAKQCEELQKRLAEQKVMTRVRCAYTVNVTVYEQMDGKQLNMGLFLEVVPLTITSDGQPVRVTLPQLRASVRGPVFLSAREEGGRIDFKTFDFKLRTTKKVILISPKGANLTYLRCEPAFDLGWKITKGETVGDKTQWELDLTIEPRTAGFHLEEDSVLILECELPAFGGSREVTRLARIPISATGSH